jgi:acetyl-CoA carboxylase biotin carboxyl carrier protein
LRVVTLRKKKPQKKAPASSSGPMSIDLLEQITRLMKDNDLNTLEVRDGEKRILLKRGAEYAAPAPTYAAPVASAAPASVAASAPEGSTPAAAAADEANLVAISSPMVGTFYASPSPDARAFVSVGSTVNEETDVCIIEAMKVFNNIKAETSGVIAKILVNNGQTVEFGQKLFLVKPA